VDLTADGSCGGQRVRRCASGLLLVALVLVLTGCGGTSKSTTRDTLPTSTPTTRMAPPTSTPTSTSTSTTSALPSGSDYAAARQQWIGDGLVESGYLQDTALSLAVMDLEQGETTDTGNRSQYASVIAAIEDFERLPITSVTPAENVEANSDFVLVNKFFGLAQTASVASCGVDGSASTKSAAIAWYTEPDNTTSGDTPGPLMTAASDLETAEAEDPSETACYPAAVDDLNGLEAATPADIAASGAPGGNHANDSFGAEIGYLNDFFSMADLPTSASPLTEPCPTC
jgi:hypothetical protein